MPVTRRVVLHTGAPVWRQRRAPAVRRDSTASRQHVDVLVIGAGISGALVAEALSEAGLAVLVVERRRPITGSTAASTALLQSDLDLPLTHLMRKVGEGDAVRHYRRSKLALRALAEATRRLEFDAELVERDALYLAGDVLDADGLSKEAAARRSAGLEVALLTRSHLKARYGLARSAAIQSFGHFAANPLKLAAGFLNHAVSLGAQVVAPFEVCSLVERRREVVATARSGATVTARFAIYATGYEMPLEVPRRRHRLLSTYAIATRPQRRALWPSECLIWEASDPYLYVRTTSDGRIICGGADEDFAEEARRDALLEAKTRLLERRLKKLMPWVDSSADYRWTGTFGATPTSTPSIGFLPRRKRTLAVLGYGGNGFTFSMIAAQVLRGLITGDGDADADLYAFRPRER